MAARRRQRRRRDQDSFGRRAKRDGLLARSVYKLEEIDRRVGLFRTGQKVLDLGAFPGSWTLYAAERVGLSGRVLGIDLKEYRGALPPNAEMRTADVFELSAADVGTTPYDVVMSDMAPSTTGHKHLDQYRSFELVMRALSMARKVLRPGGTFTAKIFQGEDFPVAKKALHEVFDKVRVVRPKATRSESYEVFLVGIGYREPDAPAHDGSETD